MVENVFFGISKAIIVDSKEGVFNEFQQLKDLGGPSKSIRGNIFT